MFIYVFWFVYRWLNDNKYENSNDYTGFVCLFRNGGSIVRHGYGKKDGNFVDVGGKIVTDIRYFSYLDMVASCNTVIVVLTLSVEKESVV